MIMSARAALPSLVEFFFKVWSLVESGLVGANWSERYASLRLKLINHNLVEQKWSGARLVEMDGDLRVRRS
jgi:hypothetical protein